MIPLNPQKKFQGGGQETYCTPSIGIEIWRCQTVGPSNERIGRVYDNRVTKHNFSRRSGFFPNTIILGVPNKLNDRAA